MASGVGSGAGSRAALCRVAAGLLVVAGLCGCATGASSPPSGHGGAAAGPRPAAAPPGGDHRRRACTVSALGVLDRWDRARAAAYASGDAARLRRLYTAGSAAGAADVRMLQQYAARGLVVAGMQRQVLDARGGHCGRRWLQVRVSDRLVRAVVRSRLPRPSRTLLPDDGPARWVLTWVRRGDRWLMSDVHLL